MPGPWIKAALLCDMVIESKDNVLSLIRVVDRIVHHESGPQAPEEMPKIRQNLKLVLMLTAGDATGRHEVRMDLRLPSGLRQTGPTLPVHFQGTPTQAVHLILDSQMEFEKEGPHWFEVFFDGGEQPIVRIPLEIMYQRIQTAPPPTG